MTAQPLLIRGDARALPLADASVDLIVTSPPYFGLRSYQDGGEHYSGQLGAEASPREFVDALIDCTREMVRVLKPTGSIFVNLGDPYDDKKSLRLLPERYRVACVDELGLTARAVLVWSKPNGLPESVTDRVCRSHEDWVHLTKSLRYFAAVDEIRGPASGYARPNGAGRKPRGGQKARLMLDTTNPLGRLPGSVWEVATQSLRVPEHVEVDHHAAFPMEWPRRLVLGWSPREVCAMCGEGRRPVVQSQRLLDGVPFSGTRYQSRERTEGANGFDHNRFTTDRRITGYACACPDTAAPSTPGVVLDPFGGTGTTALVATMLGRRGISVDLSADYGRLAQWRCSDPKERARAAGTDPAKTVVVDPGQADLFADLEGARSA